MDHSVILIIIIYYLYLYNRFYISYVIFFIALHNILRAHIILVFFLRKPTSENYNSLVLANKNGRLKFFYTIHSGSKSFKNTKKIFFIGMILWVLSDEKTMYYKIQ